MKINILQNRISFLTLIIIMTVFGGLTQFLAYCNMTHTFSTSNIWKILIPVLIGWIFFIVVQYAKIPSLFKFKWVWLGLAVLLVALTQYFGITINGQKNWLSIGSFGIYTVHWVILLYILFLSSKHKLKTKPKPILTKAQNIRNITIEIILSLSLFFFLLLNVETQIFFTLLLIFVINLILVKAPKWKLILTASIIILVAVAFLIRGNRTERLNLFLSDKPNISLSYQTTECLKSFEIGGLTGIGVKSSQRVEGHKYLLPWPTSHTSFAVIIGHFGIIGGLATLLLFVYFLYFGMMVYRRNKGSGEGFMIILLLWIIVFYTSIHILNNLGLFPFGSIISFFSISRDFNIITMITAGLIYKLAKSERNANSIDAP
jgi:cell division protein FtsW